MRNRVAPRTTRMASSRRRTAARDEKQVHHVRARDEQKERGARAEHDEAGPPVADERGLKRPHQPRDGIVRWFDGAESFPDDVGVLRRLRDRCLGGETRDEDRRNEVAERGHDLEAERQRERDPHVGAPGETEVRRHDAGDPIALAVQRQRAIHDIPSAELALPDAVRDHHRRRSVLGVFLRRRQPSRRRVLAERREEPGGHVRDPHALGLRAAGEVEPPTGVRGDVGEHRRIRGEVLDRRGRFRPSRDIEWKRRVGDRHEPVGGRERERLEKRGVDRAEDRRVRADAERQHEHHERGESRLGTQPAQRVSKILREILQHMLSPVSAELAPVVRLEPASQTPHVAERVRRGLPCVVRREAA